MLSTLFLWDLQAQGLKPLWSIAEPNPLHSSEPVCGNGRTYYKNALSFFHVKMIIHIFLFFPDLLRYKWQVTLCKFKPASCRFNTYEYYKAITTTVLTPSPWLPFLFVVRTCKIYFPATPKYSTDNYNLCAGHLILRTPHVTGGLCLLTNISPFLLPWQPPFYSLFLHVQLF